MLGVRYRGAAGRRVPLARRRWRSRASSASISASPARPIAASRRSRAQRSSASTARPGTSALPSSSPASRSSWSGVTAVQPSSCAQASWWSLPGSAARSSAWPRSASSSLPSGTHAGSAMSRNMRAVTRCRICSTETDGSLPMPADQHPDERGQRQLGLAAPCRCAALQQTARASESVKSPIDSVSVASDRGVEPDERVVEVAVVEQDQVGLLEADQLAAPSVRGPATSTSTRWIRASAPSLALVEADRDVVRPQRRVRVRGLLQHRERGERTRPSATSNSLRSVFGPAVSSQTRDQSRQVLPGARLERAQQVGERRVAPGVLGEVGADAGEEVVPAHVGAPAA